MGSGHKVTSQSIGEEKLNLVVTLGTNGASTGATISVNDGFDEAAPISSSGSGVYVLTVPKKYSKLLPGFSCNVFQAAGYDATKSQRANRVTDAVGASGTITFTTVNSAGAATQPATGDILSITAFVQK